MSVYIIDETLLQGLADALRNVNGESRTYTPAEMIEAISGGGGGGVSPVLIEWDGNTEGRASIDLSGDGSLVLYHVSDEVINPAILKLCNGARTTMDYSDSDGYQETYEAIEKTSGWLSDPILWNWWDVASAEAGTYGDAEAAIIVPVSGTYFGVSKDTEELENDDGEVEVWSSITVTKKLEISSETAYQKPEDHSKCARFVEIPIDSIPEDVSTIYPIDSASQFPWGWAECAEEDEHGGNVIISISGCATGGSYLRMAGMTDISGNETSKYWRTPVVIIAQKNSDGTYAVSRVTEDVTVASTGASNGLTVTKLFRIVPYNKAE